MSRQNEKPPPIMLDKRLRRIFEERYSVKTRLVCPQCGDLDHNNTMNGQPWCFRCNVLLVDSDKVRRFARIRIVQPNKRKLLTQGV